MGNPKGSAAFGFLLGIRTGFHAIFHTKELVKWYKDGEICAAEVVMRFVVGLGYLWLIPIVIILIWNEIEGGCGTADDLLYYFGLRIWLPFSAFLAVVAIISYIIIMFKNENKH